MKDFYINACKLISKKFPQLASTNVKVTSELKESLKFLKWDIQPFEVVILSRFALIASFIVLLIISALYLFYVTPSIIILTVSLIIPFAIAYLITEFPKNEATFERMESLGYAPTILTQIVIYLKQNPNLERALYFVSKYSEGRISDEIRDVLWKCLMGYKINIKKELRNLAEKWGLYLNELKRSLYLVIASVSEKNEIKRNQTLDRAINISLEGIINKVSEYTNQLYLPTLFLFSFGTVLPLVIISLLPILSFLGGEFSSPLQMFTILIVSLLAIYFYSNKILTNRPPSFSTIKLPEKLDMYPRHGYLKLNLLNRDIEVPALPYTILIFLVISFPGILYLFSELPFASFIPNTFSNILKGFNTLSIIWGFGISITVYSYGTSWYKKKLRDEISELEKEAIDGTYQLASRINEGRSPEDTIKHIGTTMSGTKFGELMRRTYNILRSRHTTLKNAFFNKEYGSLKNVYSKNIQLMILLFINSLKRGINTCSQTLFTISNHYDQLNKTEEKLKTTLRNALSMMRTTASIFAPMITGLVITLQQLIQGGLKSVKQGLGNLGYQYLNLTFLKTPSLSVEVLQLIAGIYMLLLALLLIRYVTLLEYGKDEIMMKYEISRNIPIALFIFTLTLIGSRIVLGA